MPILWSSPSSRDPQTEMTEPVHIDGTPLHTCADFSCHHHLPQPRKTPWSLELRLRDHRALHRFQLPVRYDQRPYDTDRNQQRMLSECTHPNSSISSSLDGLDQLIIRGLPCKGECRVQNSAIHMHAEVHFENIRCFQDCKCGKMSKADHARNFVHKTHL